MLVMYTFVTEVLGYFIIYNEDFQFFSDSRYQVNNVIIYNIYQVVFFTYFFEVYRKILQNRFSKKITFYFVITCVTVYVINGAFINPLVNQMSYAHFVGSMMMVYIVILYLKEKRIEARPMFLKHNLMFWVSVGLLAFYIPFPIILMLYKVTTKIQILVLLKPALISAIILMYASILVGLLIGKRKAFR